MNSKFCNGIRSVIAAVLHQFTLYPLFMMSNIIPFMISYLYHIDKESSEDNTSSELSSDSDDGNIRPTKRQKASVIDSYMESENETPGAGEDFTGVSGVTTECKTPQSVSEVTELIFNQPK